MVVGLCWFTVRVTGNTGKFSQRKAQKPHRRTGRLQHREVFDVLRMARKDPMVRLDVLNDGDFDHESWGFLGTSFSNQDVSAIGIHWTYCIKERD